MGPVRVLHATERYAVVEKPAWRRSVPGKGPEKQDCVAARVAALFPAATGPLVVHRLDMETSGLMVFGLDESAQRDLSRQFETRIVEKQYVALVGELRETRGTGDTQREIRSLRPPSVFSLCSSGPSGHSEFFSDLLAAEHGEVSLPMRADLENRPVQVVDFEQGREAVTRWRVLAWEIDRVRVLFEPHTGRTHQIRVHAAAGLGRPIIGDLLYGGHPAERLMLHASKLSFLDPASRARVEFESRPGF